MNSAAIWALPDEEPRQGTKTFHAPNLPADGIIFTFAELSAVEEMQLVDRQEELIKLFCVPKPGMSEPDAYPAPGGFAIPLNARMIRTLVQLEAMQPERGRWSWSSLLGLAHKRKAIFGQVMKFAEQFLGADSEGNASGAAEGSSSAPQSEPDSGIPGWISTNTPASGPSTSDSVSSVPEPLPAGA